MSESALAAEAVAGMKAAQEALAQEAARLAATGDPTAPLVAVFAQATEAQYRMALDASLSLTQQLRQARQQISDSVLRDGIARGVSLHAWAVAREMGRRNLLAACAALVLAALIGGGAGYLLHRPVAASDSLSAWCGVPQNVSRDGRYCLVPLGR